MYRRLRRALGDEVDIVSLWNGFAADAGRSVDALVVSSRLWRQVVAIAAKGAERVIVCVSARSGDSLEWELGLLASDSALLAKTTVFALPRDWFEDYERQIPDLKAFLDDVEAKNRRFVQRLEERSPALSRQVVHDFEELVERVTEGLPTSTS